jgi:hypothetical protein
MAATASGPVGDTGQGAHRGPPVRAAVDPDVSPVAITRQNVWLDRIEAEQRVADRGQLALPSDSLSEGT